MIDTLTIYKRLVSAHIAEEAAKELADVFKDVTESNLVSKANLETAKLELKKDIEIIRADLETAKLELKKDSEVLRAEIERSKVEIIKWVAGMLVAQAAVIATLVKLL